MRKIIWLILVLSLLSLSILGETIRPADASETIYIQSDGSVDPADTAILNTRNVTYTFTDNIYGRIVVERDSIVIDGADYSLEGTGSHYGIDLSERTNVTIRNTKIAAFVRGIYLYKSSSINIYGNVITGNSNGIVLYRSSNQNTIANNNITGSDYDGISSSESSNNSICGNTVTGSDYGIYLDYSSHNNVSENTVAHNKHGISVFLSSHNNTIQENNATENQEGMSLSLSSSNVLRLNTMSNNEFNIRVWGSNRSHFNNDVDSSNTVDGKSIYYWIGEQDLTVPLDAGFVVLINCTGITVHDLNLTRNQEGVLLAYTMNSTLTKNDIAHNAYGIWLHESCNNTIAQNNITDNDTGLTLFNGSANNRIFENRMINNYYGIYSNQSSFNTVFLNTLTNDAYGIWLHESCNNTIAQNNITGNQHDGVGSFQSSGNNIYGNDIAGNERGASFDGSSNNIIYHNNFVDNPVQVYCRDSTNIWDDSYPSGGNYWSDYDGHDSYCGPGQSETGRDGIGDEPYVIDESNLDNYPLMKPYPSYPIITILSPENTTYPGDSVPLTFTVDELTSWIGYSVDGHANVTTLGNTTLSGLLDGTHTLVVSANDTAGNMGTSSTVYFTVDTVAPNVGFLSPENKTYSVGSVPLTFTVDELTSWIGYSVDGQANVTTLGNKTLYGLLDGVHTLVVSANDTAGNMGTSSTVYFTVDTVAPNVGFLSPENKTYSVGSVPLTFTVDELTSWIGYSVDGHANVTTLGNTTLSGLLDGTHTLVVSANDTVGNTGTSERIYFTVKTQQAEPLQLWIVPIIVIAAGAVVILLIYFMRVKKAAKKVREKSSEASLPHAHVGHVI